MSTDPNHPERTLILTSPTGQVYISYPHSYLELPIQKAHPENQFRRAIDCEASWQEGSSGWLVLGY